MTSKVKAEGLVPDRKNCWEYFIKLIRKNLHVVLAFSPVGDDFRNRAKKFPALVNCTVIGEISCFTGKSRLRVGSLFLSNAGRMPSVMTVCSICLDVSPPPRWLWLAPGNEGSQ